MSHPQFDCDVPRPCAECEKLRVEVEDLRAELKDTETLRANGVSYWVAKIDEREREIERLQAELARTHREVGALVTASNLATAKQKQAEAEVERLRAELAHVRAHLSGQPAATKEEP